DQARQPTSGHPCCGGHGIQGAQVQASVQAFCHGDLGVSQPVQDDSGAGVQTELERSAATSQRLRMALEAGPAVHRVLQTMVVARKSATDFEWAVVSSTAAE